MARHSAISMLSYCVRMRTRGHIEEIEKRKSERYHYHSTYMLFVEKSFIIGSHARESRRREVVLLSCFYPRRREMDYLAVLYRDFGVRISQNRKRA